MSGIDLGTAVLRLGADMSGLSKGLAQAERETESWAGRASAKLQNAGAAIAGVGAKLTAGISAPLVAVGLKAVDAASDLSESISKTDVVFGENAAAVQAWSMTTATAMGQSRQQALEAAGTYGNLFTSMGMSSEASAAMSMDLVQLASDLGSFNNIDPTVALEKLRAGLTGEAEPLKTLGINLNQASIQAEALRLGLIAEGDELDAASKAQAAYSLIMQQSSNAQGDFARTSEGLANQTRITKALFADAAAQLGASLLPIATQVVSKIAELVGKFTALSPETQKFILTFAGVAAAIGPVVTFIGSLTAGVGALIGAFSTGGAAATAITAIGAALGPLLPIIAAVVAAGAALYAAWQTNFLGIRDVVAEVAGVLTDAFGRIKETVTAFVGVLSGSLSFSEFDAQLSTIWSGFGETVGTAFENIKTIVATKWAELVANVTAKAPEIAAAAAEWIGEAAAKIKEKAPEILSAAAEWAGEAVGKIKEKAGELALAAVTWLDEALVKIEAFDLGAAVETLFGTIIPGIATAVADVAVKVGEWLGGTSDTIAEFDLAEAAKTLFGTIIPGIIEKAGEILSEVGTFLTDAAQKIATHDFKSDTMTAIQTVVVGIVEKAGEILTAVGGFLGDISSAISNFSLADVAGGLIDGFVAGLQAKWDSVKGTVAGIWANITGSAKTSFQEKSPSKVFMEIGEYAMQGLGLGFEAGTAGATNMLLGGLEEVVNALAAWANEQQRLNKSANILSAKAVTDPLKEIVGNVAAIGNALTAIAMLRIPGNAADKIRQMTAAMGPVTLALAEFANEQEALNKSTNILSARAVAEPLANVAGNVQRILGGLMDLGKSNIDPARIAARVPDMLAALRTVVVKLAEFARTTPIADLGAAATVGPLLAGVMEPFSAAANAMRTILDFWDGLDAQYKRVRIINRPDRQGAIYAWTPAVEMVSAIISGLHGALAQLYAKIGDLPGELTTFAAGLRDIGSPLAAVAEAMQTIIGFWANLDKQYKRVRIINRPDRQGAVYAWTPAIDMLAAMTLSLQGAVAELHRKIGNLPDELLTFFADLSAITGALRQPLDLLTALVTWKPTKKLPDLVNALVAGITYLVQQLGTISKQTRALADDDMRRFILAMGDIGDNLQRAIGFFVDLGAWRRLPDMAERIDDFVEMLKYLMVALKDITSDFRAETGEHVRAFADAAGAVMTGLRTALELALALPDKWDVDQTVWDAFFAWAMDVFDKFIAKVVIWEQGPVSAETVEAWGNALNAVMTGLHTALNLALAVPKTWTLNQAVWDAFFAWAMDVFDKFIAKVVIWEQGEVTAATITAWANALGAVMTGLRTALDLALAVPTTWTLNQAVWDTFFAWAMDVFDKFIARVVVWEQGEVQADVVGAWGSALGSVMAGLKGALDLALAIPVNWQAPNLTTWDSFFTWANEVFWKFVTEVQEWAEGQSDPNDTATLVGAVGQAMGAVFDGLLKAIDLFKELQGYIPVLNQRIDDFLNSVTYAYGLVQTYATGPGVYEGTAATKAFADATNAVFTALGTALSVFGQLVEGTNTPELLFKQRMATLIERISGTLTAWQTYVVAERKTTWMPAADAFNSAVSSVFDVLSKALAVFGTLDSQGLPSMAQLQAFIDAVLQVFASFTSGLLTVGDQIVGVGVTVGDALYDEIGYGSSLYTTDMSAWGWNSAYKLVYALQNYMGSTGALGLLGNASTKLEAGIDSKIALGDTGEGVAGDLMLGIAAGLTPSNYTVSVAGGMTTAIDKMVAYIVAKIENELGIASPSKVMADMALNIPSGIAQGMLAGLPSIAAAAGALAAAAAPELSGLFGRDTFVTAERRIYVEIGGNAGGGAPLDAAQFDLLRRELTYAIRRGA